MGNLYYIPNALPANANAPVKVTTGTALKTMLQVATPSTQELIVVEWGIAFDGSAAATPIACELIDVAFAATVTTHTTTSVQNLTEPGGRASNLTMGTTATGFTASGEGTPSGTPRQLGWQLVAPTGMFVQQFPLGREPRVAASRFLRIRVTAGAAVNASCYVVVEEV